MKFSKLDIGDVFTCAITNGLSRKIGEETMQKISDTHARILKTTWDIPQDDARRRLFDTTGDTVKMLVPNFDPETT